MINHCSTSSQNPIVWKEVLEYVKAYLQRSPFESRVFNPNVRFIGNKKLYSTAFTIKRKIPSIAAYHIARLTPFVSAKTRGDFAQLKDAVEKCEEIGNAFEYFTGNEWIFEN